jgi:hypothetical protein
MKKLLLALLFIPFLNSAMELVSVDVRSKEEALKLYSDNKNFFVEDEDAAYRVDKHNINPLLQEVVKRSVMGKFKDYGYIRVNKLEEGKYELLAKVRGEGGFLLTGVIVHQTCRVVGYAGLAAGSASAIIAGTVAGGPAGGLAAASAAIAASPAAAAQIEAGSLFLGTAASWIPWLP